MALLKILIEIQGNLIDLWNLKSVIKDKEYNEKKGKMDWLIWINKDSMVLEYKDLKFVYPTEKMRDIDLERIKMSLDEYETTLLLREDPVEKVYGEIEDMDDLTEEEINNLNEKQENGN